VQLMVRCSCESCEEMVDIQVYGPQCEADALAINRTIRQGLSQLVATLMGDPRANQP
jgi:hypothetical protein